MRAEAWIAWRLLFSRRSLFGGSAPLAFAGLVLGVASLIASMAVVSGFERTLRESMSDVAGHVTVVIRGRVPETPEELTERLRQLEPRIAGITPIFRVEALAAGNGRIHGAILQGVDPETYASVLRFDDRVLEGRASLEPDGEVPAALIGKGLAKRFSLKPGDRLRVVMPIANGLDPERFSRRMGEFIVRGILDLGKFEWNDRFVLTELNPLRALAATGDRPQGFLLRFPDGDEARPAATRLSQALGYQFAVSDWYEINQNLFEAVTIERVIIFFVVYIIVIVAAFNIASTLFVNIIRRTDEIALLKALGLRRQALLRVFSAQGLFLGLAGFLAGAVLGGILAYGFDLLQNHYQLMAGSVYKVEGIRASIRFVDLLIIAVATIGVCFLAALAPAWRASRLSPVEGLRYE